LNTSLFSWFYYEILENKLSTFFIPHHNVTNYAYGVVKIFSLCKYKSGKFESNIETTEIGFFEKTEIPENLAVEKCTKEQILMCFEAFENPTSPTIFD